MNKVLLEVITSKISDRRGKKINKKISFFPEKNFFFSNKKNKKFAPNLFLITFSIKKYKYAIKNYFSSEVSEFNTIIFSNFLDSLRLGFLSVKNFLSFVKNFVFVNFQYVPAK